MPKVSNANAMVAIELSEESLKKFNASLDRYVNSVKIGRSKIVRKLAGGILTDVSLLTPVDTGRMRASWGAGFKKLGAPMPPIPKASLDLTPDGKTIVKKTSATEIAKGRAEGFAEVIDDKDRTEVTIRSAVRYGPYLEAGGSDQAPRGMVRVTLDRFRVFLDENMKKMAVEGTA